MHISDTFSLPIMGLAISGGTRPILAFGHVEYDGSGIDSDVTKLPEGFSVARTDTGELTITHPATLDSIVLTSFQDASGGGLYTNASGETATTKVIQIVDPTTGTHALADAADGDAVDFAFIGLLDA